MTTLWMIQMGRKINQWRRDRVGTRELIRYTLSSRSASSADALMASISSSTSNVPLIRRSTFLASSVLQTQRKWPRLPRDGIKKKKTLTECWPSTTDEPARTFRHEQESDELDGGRNSCDAQHVSAIQSQQFIEIKKKKTSRSQSFRQGSCALGESETKYIEHQRNVDRNLPDATYWTFQEWEKITRHFRLCDQRRWGKSLMSHHLVTSLFVGVCGWTLGRIDCDSKHSTRSVQRTIERCAFQWIVAENEQTMERFPLCCLSKGLKSRGKHWNLMETAINFGWRKKREQRNIWSAGWAQNVNSIINGRGRHHDD